MPGLNLAANRDPVTDRPRCPARLPLGVFACFVYFVVLLSEWIGFKLCLLKTALNRKP